MFSFAIHRLAQLQPERVFTLLHHYEAKAVSEEHKAPYARAREIFAETTGLMAGGDVPLSRKRRTELLRTLRDPKAPAAARRDAFLALVPVSAPHRYPDPEIDSALLHLLQEMAAATSLKPPDTILDPLLAARRLKGKAWDPLEAQTSRSFEGVWYHEEQAMRALTWIAQHQPEPFRARLHDLLAAELQETHGYLDLKLWSIWQADLRELKPELEKIATSGPADYESRYAGGASSQESPVVQRLHRARHIAALWNEEHPLTRAKLLVAFAAAEAAQFAEESTGAFDHLQARIELTRRSMAAPDHEALAEFISWCEQNAEAMLRERQEPKDVSSVLQKLKAALQINR